MAPLAKEHDLTLIEKENDLFKQLDKGIDNMEQGQVVLLKASLDNIMEKLKFHEV
jgi:hypothetical protein